MKISQFSEFKLIKRISKQFPKKLPKGIVGIGDDCAVFPGSGNKSYLVSTDSLVEDIHFLVGKMSAAALGYKSVIVNISDIAAMGGTPKFALLSLALPKNTGLTWVKYLIKGIKEGCEEHKVILLGGDTTASKKNIFINITIIGEADKNKIKLRSMAKVDDIICLTANIGDSGVGLRLMREGKPSNLVLTHKRPKAQVKEGQWLASKKEVHAMMDVSDGVDSDIRRILEQSGVGAIINLEKLPISKEVIRLAIKKKWNPDELALTGGEDYCLLLTVAPNSFEKLNKEFQKTFKTPLYPIGHITKYNKLLLYKCMQQVVYLRARGYDHFKK